MTKALIITLPDAPPREVASFTLDEDGVLSASYTDDALRREHERDGIWTLATGNVTLTDGVRFFAALELAYGNSSFMRVELR